MSLVVVLHARRQVDVWQVDVCISGHNWELSEGDFQTALLRALERDTRSRWRIVCANILVECVEPYRTLVLRREVLDSLRDRQQLFAGQKQQQADSRQSDSPVCPEMFQIKAELHTPLVEDGHANIMWKRSAQYLSAA